MIEALWSVFFETPNGDTGGGVIVIDTRGVYGGDTSFYYLGSVSYDPKSETISGDIQVRRHNDQLAFIFPSLDGGTYRFSGKLSKPVMYLRGHLLEAPSQTLTVRCVWIADLP